MMGMPSARPAPNPMGRDIAETPSVWDWLAPLLAITASLLVISVPVAWVFHMQHQNDIDRAAAEANAAYHPGQIVWSRIGKFRGVVLGRWCINGCRYQVRFPVASMEPQNVDEAEITTDRP